MVKKVLFVYLAFVVSVYGHEIGHFLTAKCMGIPVYKLQLGCDVLPKKIRWLSVSPFPFKGYIQVDFIQVRSLSLFKKAIFSFSGCIWNLIIIFLLKIIMEHNSMIVKIIIGVNIAYLVINLLPFKKGNDLLNFIDII